MIRMEEMGRRWWGGGEAIGGGDGEDALSGTIDMEEMVDIVTVFYSLEGAPREVAQER